MGVFTPWESADTTSQASPALRGTHRIVRGGCWSIVCSFTFPSSYVLFSDQNYPPRLKAQTFLGWPGLQWTWKHTVPFLPRPCESLKAPGSLTFPSQLGMTSWGWSSRDPPRILLPGMFPCLLQLKWFSFPSSLPPPPPHTPFWLLLCPAFVYKLPEVESLPHHGTHSAPRTAPEPVEALLPVPPTPDQPFQIQVRVHLLGLILMPDPAQNLDS